MGSGFKHLLRAVALGCAALLATAVAQAAAEEAGNVAVAAGTVIDTGVDGTQRSLVDGDTLYSGDTLTTAADSDSYADLDFLDGTRIVLHPGTTFQIQSYHFDAARHDASLPPAAATAAAKPAEAQADSAFFKLVKGGLRILDGLIGETRHDATGLETPVATIGVRGTEYDARYCADDCGDEADAKGAPENGLYTGVRNGSIGVRNDSGETVLQKGEYGQLSGRGTPFRHLAEAPRALRHMQLPQRYKARAEKMHRQLKARRQRRMGRPGRLHGGPVRAQQPQPADKPATAGNGQQKDGKQKKRKRNKHRKQQRGGGRR